MKRAAKIITVLIIVLICNTAAVAQKMAHIALDSLISTMPESKKATESLTTYAKSLEKEIMSMQSEFDSKLKIHQEEVNNWTPLVRENKEKELQDLQGRIESFKQQASQEYQAKTAELSRPVYEKAKKAVEMVAKENAYKYVLDSSQGMILYSEESDNIFALVKKKLDSMPEAVIPGSAQKTTETKPKTTGTVKAAAK